MIETTVVDSDPDIALYRRMRMLRRFEEVAADLARAGEIVSAVHEYTGQEAVAVGVCSALRADDVITSTHRGHGHILAKGGDPARMLAELLGRESGYNRGRGGSMHIADLDLGIFGANGIVGAGAPMACGAAYMFQMRGEAHVAAPFFGDGAVNQGVLLESFNLASMMTLPVIFVCENNGYAVTTPIGAVMKGAILDRAAGFGLAAEAVDGMDVRAVRGAAERAVERARGGGGPSFLECDTCRYSVHNVSAGSSGVDERAEAELAEARARDPIERLAGQLIAEGRWVAEDRTTVDGEVDGELDGGLGFARNSRRPDPASAHDFMYSRDYPGFPARGAEE
jgi:acetoin:2,6-dichlorophenolindophenol oxidoreductase subunit alpha